MSLEPLKGGLSDQGGKGSDGERIVRLETQFSYFSRDQDEIRESLKALLSKIEQLPTRNDLWQWKMTWSALMLAVVAIIVGSIIGGLSWLKPDAPATIQTIAPSTEAASPSRSIQPVLPAPRP